MIIFEKIRWKNLLSTGNTFTEIDLNSHNHTLIVGENGSGKSTFLDALMFALYGKPFRKINKPQLLNAINGRDMLVECDFKIGEKKYLIKRGIKPNIFEIYVNDTLLNLESSSIDYQEYFEKNILKINYKSFSQVVILGSASFVPFMQLTASNRREVVEDLLDIQIFSVMNTLLKEKVTVNQNSLQEVNYQLINVNEKIELEKKHVKELQNNTQEYIQEKQEQIEQYHKKIEDYNLDLNKINSEAQGLLNSIKDEKTISSKSKKLSSMIEQLYAKRDKIQEDVEFFEHHESCPSCSQGISHEHKEQIVNEKNQKLDVIKQAIDDALTKQSEYQKRLDEITKLNKKIESKKTEYNSIKNQIKLWSDLIAKLQKEIDAKSNKEVNEEQRLDDLLKDLELKESTKKELIEEKSLLSVASTLMKDTGIKTKIISQYVPVINQLINKYLSEMDFFVNFELNESFEETIKSRFRDEFSYSSFSEGEKSRLDLALLFTWRAIAKLRNSASTNLLILDEVFDGSLDNEGSEKLINIIKALTQGNNVFIISHKTDSYLDKFDRVIKFVKNKNFSGIKQL